jgi:diguanylate cyclase (GGDEF)-like protein/PAS domain S-box-containing protein
MDDIAETERVPDASSSPDAEPTAANWVKAQLAIMAALLNITDDDRSFRDVFRALHAVFTFDRALVLEDTGDGARCIAAEAAATVGHHWPDASLRTALHVCTLPASANPGESHVPPGLSQLTGPNETALGIPIGVSGRPALLLLIRTQGTPEFTTHDTGVARTYAAIAMATLAASLGTRLETEIQRLNRLMEQSRLNEYNAQQERALLKEIIDHLPISLTVQDESGRFLLANAMAAANLQTPPELLAGASPADFLPEQEAAYRREWEQNVIQRGETITVEGILSNPDGERTWLTWHKPVRALEQTLLISSSIDITEHKQVERELVERAHIDQLTGLPNRILIQEQVDAIIRNDDGSHNFALAFIDLDNFKHINDYYSHSVGDALLVKIGQRIGRWLRPSDMLARISGDEFLLLLCPFESEDRIRPLINGILEDLKQPFHIEAFEVFSSCSIGVSVYPEHGRGYEALRRNADSAMYRAKHVAKGDAVFFDLNMGRAMTAQMELEQRLRLAIRDRRFCCAFQPKVDIYTEQVVGVETLVRWRDDDGEIQPPGEFIGLAVELGLINPITNFVMAEAVSSMDRIDAAFGEGTTVSINVAAKQANDLEFMELFTQALRDSGHAERIIIELTEEAFISKGEFQTKILPILREIGARVSIDDFGTGYSSLSALADITADEIKIDRSFISAIHERPRNQSVLRAIESLGHALGMTIVAEGVETYEELAYLHAATRIRYAQGFYYARPLYLDSLTGEKKFDVTSRIPQSARLRPERQNADRSRLAAPARSA